MSKQTSITFSMKNEGKRQGGGYSKPCHLHSTTASAAR